MKAKQILLILLTIALIFALPACFFAAERSEGEEISGSPYSDVPGGAWYAEAVRALQEQGLMNGVGGDRFDPDGVFTRAQLATVLYRMAGSPALSGEDDFNDTQSGTWYSDAVLWASRNGIVNGYGDGRFGTNDATTQEQMAVMLWRSAGSYVLGPEYADANGVENAASSWAVDAVRWARVDGLFSEAIPFTPQAPATRAQVADMVWRYLLLLERFGDPDVVSGASQSASAGPNVLVAYFSCTGNTGKIAGFIADGLGAELYQITPETPYTAADLNYGSGSARATLEQNDPNARPALAGMPDHLQDYDVIFLGYPIWFGQAPKILYTFVESADLSGKTIVPFCTSGSSGIGSSASGLSASAPDADWLSGARFSGSASRASVLDWVNGLGLALSAK